MNQASDIVYLDYNATTPVIKNHFEQVSKLVFDSDAVLVGNPSSLHTLGRKGRRLLEQARLEISKYLSCPFRNIVFTSGASEANNFVIRAVAEKNPNGLFIYCEGDHPSISVPIKVLAHLGRVRCKVLPLLSSGAIDETKMWEMLDEETPDFLSLTCVNNETGVIIDTQRLSAQIKQRFPGCYIHWDGVQALGKIDLVLGNNQVVNSVAFSGHKIGAFSGIGCLYLQKLETMVPLIFGGGQESGVRAGTENIFGAVSFGLQVKMLGEADQKNVNESAKNLEIFLLNELSQFEGIRFHGDRSFCVPNTINFWIPDLKGPEFILNCEMARICISGGSACSSGTPKPSSVLKAMGCSDEEATNAVRISMGKGTSKEELQKFLQNLKNFLNVLAALSSE